MAASPVEVLSTGAAPALPLNPAIMHKLETLGSKLYGELSVGQSSRPALPAGSSLGGILTC